MYEENRDQRFDGNATPDEYRSEEAAEGAGNQEQEDRTQGQQEAAPGYQNQARQEAVPGYQSQGQQETGPVYQNQGQRVSGDMGGQTPPQFRSRETHYYNQPGGSQNGPAGPTYYNNQPPRPPKRKGLVRKVAGITAAALLFGTVSGATMVGVNKLAGSSREETYPQVSQAETQTEPARAQAGQPSNGGQAVTAPASALPSLDVSAIVENAMPSIVAINNTMLYESNSWFGGRQTYEVPGSGSGIIVGQNEEELLVVTNNHVVENSNTLSVVFIDSVSVNAAIKGTDADFDLAVVAVPLKDIPAETLSKITVAKMGSSDDLKVGQGVIAIGNALGYGQSVTVGWVSALDREVTTEGSTTRNLLQTDAAINPGNSGGALLNMKGEVIGINAAKYSSTDVEGIGYAIPISKAEDIINSLMTKRRSGAPVEEGQEGYLGIQGLTVGDNMARQLGMPSGIFVSGIIEDGAASRTELREKDIITKFDDQTVRSMAALQELLKYYKAGETVNMTVQTVENGQYVERTIEITLGSRETLNGGTPVRQ